MLEAHDWNEDECAKSMKLLNEYFLVATIKDLDLVKADLGLIFSETVSSVIFNYIDHVYLKIINDNGGDDETN